MKGIVVYLFRVWTLGLFRVLIVHYWESNGTLICHSFPMHSPVQNDYKFSKWVTLTLHLDGVGSPQSNRKRLNIILWRNRKLPTLRSAIWNVNRLFIQYTFVGKIHRIQKKPVSPLQTWINNCNSPRKWTHTIWSKTQENFHPLTLHVTYNILILILIKKWHDPSDQSESYFTQSNFHDNETGTFFFFVFFFCFLTCSVHSLHTQNWSWMHRERNVDIFTN